jgi:DNA-binding MarR family transcriptional regulator
MKTLDPLAKTLYYNISNSSKGESVPAEFSDDDKRMVRSLAEVLEQFTSLRPNIPAHQIIMLLRLALDEGKSQKFYSDNWDFSPSTVSRAILDLSDRTRKGEEGLGLLDRRVSVRSLREQEVFISPKGRTMLQRIIKKFSR